MSLITPFQAERCERSPARAQQAVICRREGKVRPLLEKFQAMNRIMANAGQGNMRLMTDFSGERYWTLVAEFETPGMAEFEKMMQGDGMSEADTKEFERLMEGYHDLIDSGHREIYRLEPATKA